MEPICTNPNCENKVTNPVSTEDTPRLLAEIKDDSIDNILNEHMETFHVHQYGSMVIFLEYLEGIEPNEAIIEEYSKQGHVFLLPMKAYDLVQLKNKEINNITYKASDSERMWYKITITTKQKGVKNKLRKMFH